MTGALDGHTAIVTGAGRGIGRIVARALASAGASVAVVARSRDELAQTVSQIEAAGGRGLACPADVRDRDAVEGAVARVEAELGAVDLLVNNAGTGDTIGPSWEVDAEAWWRDVEVVLRGAHLLCRAVLPRMIERRRGRIVNVTSRAGTFGTPYQTAYSCSRAAIFLFTEGLAQEVREHGIRVFAFTPGVTKTALTLHLMESDEGKRWAPGFAAWTAGSKAWKRPELVGEAVVVLATGRADALSGRWIHAEEELEALVRRAGEIGKRETRVLRMRE